VTDHPATKSRGLSRVLAGGLIKPKGSVAVALPVQSAEREHKASRPAKERPMTPQPDDFDPRLMQLDTRH
jgi:hypothetical protein